MEQIVCPICRQLYSKANIKKHQSSCNGNPRRTYEWIEEKTKELKDQGLSDEDIKNLQFIPEDYDDFIWDEDFD